MTSIAGAGTVLRVFAICGSLLGAMPLGAEPVAVRYTEGVVHGFLALRTLEGVTIAQGDLVQTVRAARVTTRLTFHFKDGSLHDETATFSQRADFRLIRDHLVQTGPSFPHPLDMSIDAGGGLVTVSYRDGDQPKKETERMDLPPDLSNGLLLTLLKNISPNTGPRSFSFVAAMPKPRLVKLSVQPAQSERLPIGGRRRVVTHYVVKVDLGTLAGVAASLLGKRPPDSHVWILEGDAPAFVRAEQPLYPGGPVWRIELAAPAWRGTAVAK